MKTLVNKTAVWTGIGIFFMYLSLGGQVFGQAVDNAPMRMSLQEAIWRARSNNKRILVSKIEKEATVEDLKDANATVLPSVSAAGSYQRFTKLTLYTDGLSNSHSVPKNPGPNGADLGVSANFNLYSGGRTRAFQAEQKYKTTLAELGVTETSGNVSLQVAGHYLDIIRLSGQKKVIQDQIVRAETRLRNIKSLFNNQKVTRSDLLRAEVNLSNSQLNLEQTENDISIANKKLNVLMAVPENVVVSTSDTLDSPNLTLSEIDNLVQSTVKGAYGILKYDENIKIQNARIKGVKSNYYPTVAVVSAYGINYPNNLFFPPVDQAYSIGFVGLKVQYNISSLYQNKHKVAAANVRMRSLEIQKSDLADELNREAVSLAIKYNEALNRIEVVKKQIEQASVNYKIVSSKYFNQLALLTDLLDADNLYQESRYNLIQAQTNLKILIYRLEYTSGKL